MTKYEKANIIDGNINYNQQNLYWKHDPKKRAATAYITYVLQNIMLAIAKVSMKEKQICSNNIYMYIYYQQHVPQLYQRIASIKRRLQKQQRIELCFEFEHSSHPNHSSQQWTNLLPPFLLRQRYELPTKLKKCVRFFPLVLDNHKHLSTATRQTLLNKMSLQSVNKCIPNKKT